MKNFKSDISMVFGAFGNMCNLNVIVVLEFISDLYSNTFLLKIPKFCFLSTQLGRNQALNSLGLWVKLRTGQDLETGQV